MWLLKVFFCAVGVVFVVTASWVPGYGVPLLAIFVIASILFTLQQFVRHGWTSDNPVLTAAGISLTCVLMSAAFDDEIMVVLVGAPGFAVTFILSYELESTFKRHPPTVEVLVLLAVYFVVNTMAWGVLIEAFHRFRRTQPPTPTDPKRRLQDPNAGSPTARQEGARTSLVTRATME